MSHPTSGPAGSGPPAPSSSPSSSGNDNGDGVPWGTWLRGAAFVVFLLAMAWLALNVEVPDLDVLRARIDDAGVWGWVVFTLVYTVVAITPIPVTIVALAGGVALGVVEGSILSSIGAMAGAMIAYGIARALGGEVVLRLLGNHRRTVERWLSGGGFDAVFTLRVMPGVPYWPVNYGAGALRVPVRTFTIASALATIPGQVALVSIGAFLVEPGWGIGITVVVTCAIQLVLALRALRQWRARVQGGGSEDA